MQVLVNHSIRAACIQHCTIREREKNLLAQGQWPRLKLVPLFSLVRCRCANMLPGHWANSTKARAHLRAENHLPPPDLYLNTALPPTKYPPGLFLTASFVCSPTSCVVSSCVSRIVSGPLLYPLRHRSRKPTVPYTTVNTLTHTHAHYIKA